MADKLYCRKGHWWQPTFAPNVWPPDFRSSCPTCGEAPIGPFDWTSRTARVAAVLGIGFLLAGLPVLLFNDLTLISCSLFPLEVIFLIVAAVMPLIGVWVREQRQRTKKMAAVAEAMDFSFMAQLTLASLRALAPFRFFTEGHSGKVYNAMIGQVGGQHMILVEFQNKYEIEWRDLHGVDRKGTRTRNYTVALLPDGVPNLARYHGGDGHWTLEVADGHLLVCQKGKLPPDKFPGVATDALETRDMLRVKGSAPA